MGAAPSHAQAAPGTNTLWHSQPIPSTPRACQVIWHRDLSPRSTQRQVTPATNTLWHLPRDPRWEAMGFFYGFANYSVFLCRLPPECVPGMGPSPGSSSKCDSSWQAAAQEGEDHPGWVITPRLCCVPCLHWQQQLLLLVGGKVELEPPCLDPAVQPLYTIVASHPALVTRTRSSSELPALCLLCLPG